MAMNRVQFQPGLSMPEFMDQYGTEEQCEDAVFASRCQKEHPQAGLSLEEVLPRNIASSKRHVWRWTFFEAAFKSELKLHAARVVYKELPQRCSRYYELTPIVLKA